MAERNYYRRRATMQNIPVKEIALIDALMKSHHFMILINFQENFFLDFT